MFERKIAMKTIVRIVNAWFKFSARVLGQRGYVAFFFGLIVGAVFTPAHAGSAVYKYDSLGRLSTATYNNGAVITYVYDAAGNRTSYTVSGAPAAAATALKTTSTTGTAKTTKSTATK